ncbi:MAG: acyl-CoA/acyl-ACP dehydrogenase [Nevskia sp.]|nr:acyl-CoA/acyl-ACP dehydrogenase [Nevskia sp.]
MNFHFSKEQEALRDRVVAFCAAHCPTEGEARRDRHPAYPAELHQAMATAGILGHCLPAAYDGGGGGTVDLCVINEEVARHSTSASNILFVNGICGALIGLAGSEEQKQRYVRGIAGGGVRFAFALTEPGAGSDAAAIQLGAVRDTDGYLLNGTKLYTTGAADADFILTAARTATEGKASRGTSLLIVPRQSAGLTITPLDKIAGNDVASCRIEYRDVRVARDACLGGENQGWSFLMLGGGLERLTVAASCVGLARAAFEEALAYVNTREQFGQPVARFQAIQHQLADMATRIEAMRLLTYSAAWKIAQGLPAIKEVSMAKVFAAEGVNEIVMNGMRLLGAKAYLNETPMQRRMRESLLALYAGGTCEIQRNVIARSLGL